jgi:hypothetical protein
MHPQALIAAGRAAQHAVTLASTSLERRHEHKLSKLRVAVVEMMTSRVTESQLRTIKETCDFVLAMMAKEHELYRDEYVKDATVRRASSDVVVRAELDSSMDKARRHMERLCAAAIGLHTTSAVLLERAAGQILEFTGDLTVHMPQSLIQPRLLPVLDVVPVVKEKP